MAATTRALSLKDKPPPALSLGVEEEYLLVDAETRDLAPFQPEGFMAACRARLGEQVTEELLQAQVEIGTSVCKDVGEVRADLIAKRRAVIEVAESFGLVVLATSTHPFANWREQHRQDVERYRVLTQDLQYVARKMVICGMHVHAGVEDPDMRIELMNQVSYFLPHLLALSASSPFWEGQDTGLASFRPTIFGDLPRTGLPERFETYGDWERFLEELQLCGLCDDPTKIWWDIRPSVRQPTLEVRVCDMCTRLDDAVAIAAAYQALLRHLYLLRRQNLSWRPYRRMFVDENKWLAQRHGVNGALADLGALCKTPMAELVRELVEIVTPAASELGSLDDLGRLEAICAEGASADKQRAVYERALEDGADNVEALRAVVDWIAAETRRGVF